MAFSVTLKTVRTIAVKEYQLIAQYYVVWCRCRELKLQDDVLESIVDQSQTYRAKAFLSLAGFAELRGNFELELYFLKESLKTKPNISDYIQAVRAMGIVKAIEGFHTSALKDLESLIPLIRHAEPLVYYDFLNSYAVELWEAGRKSEARNIIKHVIASPFAPFYPEWQDTANDLKEPSRSIVALSPSKFIPHNVLDMPATEHSETEQQINESDSIQSPLSLGESDDNVLEFPHLVDLEKLERESNERFNAEMERFAALIDNCQLHDFVDSILIGDMNPARFAKFLLRMSKFEDIKMVQDVFHWMLRYTFINADEFKESETEWTEKLLKEIESTDTL